MTELKSSARGLWLGVLYGQYIEADVIDHILTSFFV